MPQYSFFRQWYVLDGAANVRDGLSLINQLLSGLEPEDDLVGFVTNGFMMQSGVQLGRMRSLIHCGLTLSATSRLLQAHTNCLSDLFTFDEGPIYS